MVLKKFINGLKKIKINLSSIKIISLILVVIFLSACINNNVINLKINDQILNIEVSDDALSKAKGLSGRENLGENCGMIFLFSEEARHTFWMKDMNFPLDIIYVRENEIVEIFKNVPIFDEAGEITEIFPEQKADKIIELKSGWCDLYGVQTGDKIEL